MPQDRYPQEGLIINSKPGRSSEIIKPNEEDFLTCDAARERDFEQSIRISLEKLSGYEDSRLLAVYPEYALNNAGNETTGDHILVMNAGELREKIAAMRDPEKTITKVRDYDGQSEPEIIIIVYDDLPAGTTSEKARKRWADFYKDINRNLRINKIGSDEELNDRIREAKFNGLNELRGLRGGRALAIRDIFSDDIKTYTVAELRKLIEDMENHDNDLTCGTSYTFFIEAYDNAEKFAENKHVKLTVRDMDSRQSLLSKISAYPDDTLLTWYHPNEMHDFSTGGFIMMQDTAAVLRRKINTADHEELRWFDHAGGIKIAETGEVDMKKLERELIEGERQFQAMVGGVANSVNARASGKFIDDDPNATTIEGHARVVGADETIPKKFPPKRKILPHGSNDK